MVQTRESFSRRKKERSRPPWCFLVLIRIHTIGTFYFISLKELRASLNHKLVVRVYLMWTKTSLGPLNFWNSVSLSKSALQKYCALQTMPLSKLSNSSQNTNG